MSTKPLSLVGSLFIAFPIAINVPFAVLARNFEYPRILSRPAGEVLTLFGARGLPLLATWYAFALVGIPFFAAMVLLPKAVGREDDASLRLGTAAGVLAGTLQVTALLRWVFAVPLLARLYLDPASSEATRAATTVTFDVLHRFVGIGMGEHLGPLFLAAWTALAAGAMVRAGVTPRWLAAVGRISALVLVIGLANGVARALDRPRATLDALPAAGFLLWSAWVIGSGVYLLRAAHRPRTTGDPTSPL
jgi:hypothetical protein